MASLPRKCPSCAVCRRCGFSLVEAMVAVTITAMAGAAILLGIQTSLQTTTHGIEQTMAQGLALQLMDEISGNRYVEYGVGPYQTILVPSADELATGTRELFDDIDDFNGQDNCPPRDAFGIKLGEGEYDGDGGMRNINFRAPRKLLDRLCRKVEVFYVNENDFATRLPSGQTSDYRAVEVSVHYIEDNGDQRELVRLRRLVAYFPPSKSP